MRFFIAGIMQGSHVEAVLHGQDYREQLTTLLGRFYPDSDIYDPRHQHRESLHYDDQQGRDVFMMHNRMCGEVDVVVAGSLEGVVDGPGDDVPRREVLELVDALHNP